MDLRFADKKLERLYTDATYRGKYPQGVVKAFRQAVFLIANACDERDIRDMKSWHFKKLAPGGYSARLNDQFRLLLDLEGSGKQKVVVIRGIEDYHD